MSTEQSPQPSAAKPYHLQGGKSLESRIAGTGQSTFQTTILGAYSDETWGRGAHVGEIEGGVRPVEEDASRVSV